MDYPFLSVTYICRFLLGAQGRTNSVLTNRMIKDWGIPHPSKVSKAFRMLNLISEENKLTELGEEFINVSTRKKAARKVLESPFYYEILLNLQNGVYTSKKGVREYIEGITAWKTDAVDKAIALLAYFLRIAEIDTLMEIDFIKNAQITPKRGTRKGKRNRSKTDL